ncbi:hypothetical protein FB559_6848 [Actinoallomurus bryophytorum]|uniref:Uncharacterized protein n=1 Tax=Actinoallomurus bryophytorum TaxID=1490222 RepID=A0A543CVH2_9ACTN|nr:hypothetical protein FB559_6848 [Actinoallomurus bryophytorum]
MVADVSGVQAVEGRGGGGARGGRKRRLLT